MTPKSAEEVAREIRDIAETDTGYTLSADARVAIDKLVAQALRAARREALEEAAKSVEALGPGPNLLIATVLRDVVSHIRALASSDEEKGGG